MDQLYFQTPYKAYQEIFVFVKNALMCHYHQTEQKWSTSRDALTPYLQYKGAVHKRRHQFGCHIDAAEQQRALNFELVVSDQLFSVILVAYK